MAKLDNVRRIVKEDYDKKYHDLINKLAYTLNTFMEGVVSQVNGNMDFSNLRQEVIVYRTKVDAQGTPLKNTKIASEFTNPSGILVIKAVNASNSSDYVTAQPFVSYRQNNSGTIDIKNIRGLTADTEYDLTLLIID